MSKIEQKFNEFFDITKESNINLPEKLNIESEGFEKDFKNDYDIARNNFLELIETGKTTIDCIIQIAKESEKARDFEVAAELLRDVLNANEQLIELHKKVKEITEYKRNKPEKINNTTVFLGSTSELAKLLKELNENVIDIN